MRRPSAAEAATLSLLVVIVAAGLALRLWHNDFGLPFVYNVDERRHFASRAVAMIVEGGLDPGYYKNPAGFTYLVYLALRLRFAERSLGASFGADPTAVIELARAVAAGLGALGVVAVYAAGRRLWDRRVGLVAAAVLAFAFLAVAYSRLALTDVGTLAPAALALLGSVLVVERGRVRDHVLAGAGVGLAIGFKYTAGLVLLPVAIAAAVRLVRARDRRSLAGAGAGLLAALAALLPTAPFLFANLGAARGQLAAQAEAAASPKLGQAGESPVGYYLTSLTWGLGWVLVAAALGGAVVVARRDRPRAAVLLALPVALFVYLCLQERFFGRWLLPAYPALALLAAVGLTEAARRAAGAFGRGGRGSRLEPAILAGLCALALAQPLLADWRSARLLGRTDTRTLARQWLERRYPPDLRIVVEPEAPWSYFRSDDGDRRLFPAAFQREARLRRQAYSDTLSPATLERYRASGYCLVMTLGYVRGRVEKDHDPRPSSYYRRLERESRTLYRASPQRPGSKPLPFHFDFSYNGYPPSLVRPGPDVRVLALDRCRQGYGSLSGAERRAAGLLDVAVPRRAGDEVAEALPGQGRRR